MFIRTKQIKGHQYAYNVQNSWTEKGARQKVAKYLGKVTKPERIHSKTLKEFLEIESIEQYVETKDFKEIIKDIIKLELYNHGIEDNFFMNGSEFKTISGKNAVIQANQGFICSENIKNLHTYSAEGDDGFLLANLVTTAGINLEKDLFVLLYEKAKIQIVSNTVQKEPFYY